MSVPSMAGLVGPSWSKSVARVAVVVGVVVPELVCGGRGGAHDLTGGAFLRRSGVYPLQPVLVGEALQLDSPASSSRSKTSSAGGGSGFARW